MTEKEFLVLPGIVWIESLIDPDAGRVETETAAVEVDRVPEALPVVEAPRHGLDRLNLGVHRLGAGIGDPMRKVGLDVGPVPPQSSDNALN